MNEQVKMAGGFQDPANGCSLGCLMFYPEELTLWKGKTRIPLAYQGAVLLKLILATPRWLISEEDLKKHFKESSRKVTDYEGAISTAFQRLRKALKADSRIRLGCVSKIGYQLWVTE